MKKLLFALYDTEGYMMPLAGYFGKKFFMMECRLFTKKDCLLEFLKGHQVDVLLLGQEVEAAQLSYLEHVKKVIILSEEKNIPNQQNIPIIFKYQSAEKVCQEIFQMIAQEEIPFLSARETRENIAFYGLYRPYGSLLQMQKLYLSDEAKGKKSLVINLEPLSGFDPMEERNEEDGSNLRGMSELVFYLKQHSEKIALKLRVLVQKWKGMDCIYPVEDYRDLYSLNCEEIDLLLSVLAEETDYELVLFDVGFLSDASLYLLYCCDRIYIPQAVNDWEENQKKSLERLLEREGMEEMKSNIHYVSA